MLPAVLIFFTILLNGFSLMNQGAMGKLRTRSHTSTIHGNLDVKITVLEDWMTGIGETVKAKAQEEKDKLEKAAETAKTDLENAAETVKTGFDNAAESAKEGVETAAKTIEDGLLRFPRDLKTFVTNATTEETTMAKDDITIRQGSQRSRSLHYDTFYRVFEMFHGNDTSHNGMNKQDVIAINESVATIMNYNSTQPNLSKINVTSNLESFPNGINRLKLKDANKVVFNAESRMNKFAEIDSINGTNMQNVTRSTWKTLDSTVELICVILGYILMLVCPIGAGYAIVQMCVSTIATWRLNRMSHS